MLCLADVGVPVDGFMGNGAKIGRITALAIDRDDTVLFVDSNVLVRRINQNLISTLAGDLRSGYNDSSGRSALFDSICGLSIGFFSTFGNIFVSDRGNNAIRGIGCASGSVM